MKRQLTLQAWLFDRVRAKPSICYVLDSFPEPSETFVSEEATGLLDQGVTPYVLSLHEANKRVLHPSARRILELGLVHTRVEAPFARIAYALGVMFLRQPIKTAMTLISTTFTKNRWRYLQALPYALMFARLGARFFHTHFAAENLRWAHALSAWTRTPYGVTTHRYDLLDDPLPREEARRLFMSANLLVTISEYNKRLMVEKYGVPAEKISVIRCGIDLTVFTMNTRPLPRGIPLRLLNVGRLVAIKGQDTLLRALVEVKRGGVDFHLDIIGGGELLDVLSKLSEHLGLRERVTFLGPQPQDVVLSKLRAADVFILPSRSEGLSVACVEAMAVGVPTIATRVAGMPELIRHMENGILVEAEDVRGLADAISIMAESDELIARMRLSARRSVEVLFDKARSSRELLGAMALAWEA